MYYADLSVYEYGASTTGCSVALNVGWLDACAAFATGPVADRFLDQLLLLIENPVNLTRGSHPCAFCLSELRAKSRAEESGKLLIQALRDMGALGNGEIVVQATNDICYVAPTLVLHYVERHEYRPPSEFIDAVMQSSK